MRVAFASLHGNEPLLGLLSPSSEAVLFAGKISAFVVSCVMLKTSTIVSATKSRGRRSATSQGSVVCQRAGTDLSNLRAKL